MIAAMSQAPPSLTRGTIVGGWEVQRVIGERPWPEVKAARADGVVARLLVVPLAAPPDAATLARWRAAAAPAWLDHPAFPALHGLGFDERTGALWIARAWSAWRPLAAVLAGELTMPPGRRGAALCSLGEALARLHAGGGAHGAMAPARVLLARADGGACEVLDLGLAAIAAELGVAVPGAIAAPVGATAAAADLAAFATIAEAVAGGAAAEAVRARTSIADALAALRAILPAPERDEAPPPPPPPPTAEEQARIDAAARARAAASAARTARSRPAPEPPRRGAPPGDRDPPFVPPIEHGGPAIDPASWPTRIRARRADAGVTVDALGTVTTGVATWRLGAGQRAPAADAIADAIARALAVLADNPPGWLVASPIDRALAAAGFTAVDVWPQAHRRLETPARRPRGEAWWHRPGARVIVHRRAIEAQREYTTWLGPHDLGHRGATVVELPARAVPRDVDARDRLVTAILDVVARVDERPTLVHVCRFCRRELPGLHFHPELGACHGCSEAHLHIVH
jgi:hypothetical protein